MKRILCVGLAAVLLGQWLALSAFGQKSDSLSTDAKACIVMEASSGRILGEENSSEKLPMASTTKIMTALLALEQPELDEWFTVDSDAIHVEGSSMGLQEGDSVTLRALVYGMLLPSGNDAANAAAVRISGSQEAFVAKMNQKAAELGLENTQFKNPSGLDAQGHYSTAYDMALLCREAMKNEDFREICCLSKAQVSFGNPPYNRWLENYNKLLTMYPDCIGVKTGFTEAAYRCLVSAAEKNGITLICVTLNCADDWAVHEELYEHYFGRLETISPAEYVPESLPLAVEGLGADGQATSSVAVKLGVDEELALLEGDVLDCQLLCPPLILAPVSEGSVVGELLFSLNGKEWRRCPLLAAEDVLTKEQENPPGLIDRIYDFIIQLF